MGIFNQAVMAGRRLGVTPSTPDPGASQGFSQTLRAADLLATTTTVNTTTFVIVGSYTIPAQTRYQWGVGVPQLPENQGYLYVKLFDDTCIPVVEEGVIRLETSDFNLLRRDVVFERHTTQLYGSLTDRKLQIAFPRVGRFLFINDKMVVEMHSDAADVVVAADSTMEVPVTYWSNPT